MATSEDLVPTPSTVEASNPAETLPPTLEFDLAEPSTSEAIGSEETQIEQLASDVDVSEESSSEAITSEESSSEEVTSEEETITSEETSSEETPSEETPSEEAPSEETPSEESTSEESTSEESTSEETPSEERLQKQVENGTIAYTVKELKQIEYLEVHIQPDLTAVSAFTFEILRHPAVNSVQAIEENGRNLHRIYFNENYLYSAPDEEAIELSYILTYPDDFNGTVSVDYKLHEAVISEASRATEDITPYKDIILTHRNENATVPVQTHETMIMMVSVNGAPMTQTLENSYIDITVPLNVVDIFTVPPAPSIVSTKDIKNSEENLWTKRVYLQNITTATKFDFPVNFSFTNSMAPEGTILEPDVMIYTAEDPETGQGALIKEAEGTTAFEVLYLPWKITKTGPINANDGNLQTAGLDTNGDRVYDTVFDVAYTFPIGIKSFYGHGARFIEKATVTDTLPTYLAGPNGSEEKTAFFDPDKNPDWTLSEDGKTVSATLTIPQVGQGITALSRNLTLILSFPDLYLNKESKKFGFYQNVNNTATAELIPFGYDPEKNPETITTTPISDSVSINMIGNIDTEGMLNKFFYSSYGGNNRTNFDYLDVNQMHMVSQSRYSVDIVNRTSFPITNLVIRDADIDPKLYLRAIRFQKVTSGPSLVDFDLYGIADDGTETLIPQELNATNDIWVEKETHETILAQAQEWEANTSQPVPEGLPKRKFHTYELRLQEGKSLMPGERLLFYWFVNYLQPYQLELSEHVFRNAFSIEGVSVIDDESVPINVKSQEAKHQLIEFPATMWMQKVTRDNSTGSLNSKVQFDLKLELAKTPKGTVLRNGKFVDLLPPGFEFVRLIPRDSTRDYVNFSGYTLTEDHMGSGRTLLEVPLLDSEIMVRDLPELMQFTVEAKITEFAYNSIAGEEADENHKNFTYFTTSDMKHLPGKTLNHGSYISPQVIEIDGIRFGRHSSEYPYFQDKYDVNKNGNTDEYLVAAESPVIVTLPREIRGIKSIRHHASDPWLLSGIETAYDSTFQYRLRIMNNGTVALRTIDLFDRLPHVGDQNSFSPDQGASYPARESGWSVKLQNAVIAPAGYTVLYSTSPNLGPNPSDALEAADWVTSDQVADWSAVTAIHILNDEGTVLAPSQAVDFILNVRAPSYVKGKTFDFDRANNNFVVSYDEEREIWGQSNTVYHKLLKSFAVHKEWEGPAADAVRMLLLQNNKPYEVDLDGDGVTEPWSTILTAEGEWYEEFYNLPAVDSNGRPYTYTVNETAIIVYERDESGEILTDEEDKPRILREDPINDSDYSSSVTGSMITGFVYKNTYQSPETPIKADLTWLNGANISSKPDVTFTLRVKSQTGEYTDVLDEAGNPVTITVSSDDTFTDGLNFGQHPIFDSETGEPLTYTLVQSGLDDSVWQEQSVSEVTPAKSGDRLLTPIEFGPDTVISDDTIHVVNRYVPPTADLTADTEWVNGENALKPGTTLSLQVEGVDEEGNPTYTDATDTEGNPITGTVGEDGVVTFPNVPLTDKDGKSLSYTVTQTGLEDSPWLNESISTITPYGEDGEVDPSQTNIHVVNKYVPPTVDITVTNEWIDGPVTDSSEAVKYTLIRRSTVDGEDVEETVVVDLVPNADGTYSFPGVPTTDLAGNPYTYTINQTFNDPVIGKNYTTTVSSITPATAPDDLNIEIVNRYVPPTADLTADTEWVNGENALKPGTTLSLQVEGVDEEGNPTYTDATDTEGNPITGTVGEDGVVTFPNVPLTDKDGKSLSYTVTQTGLEDSPWLNESISTITPYGEDGEVDPNQTNIYVVNSYVPSTATLTADTEWLGGEVVDRPDTKLTLIVLDPTTNTWSPASDLDGNVITGTSDENGVWTYPDVPLTDLSGTPLIYSVTQTGLADTLWYERSITQIQPQQADGTLGETKVHVVNEYDPAVIDLTADTEWVNGNIIEKPPTALSLMVKDPTTDEWIEARDKDGNIIEGRKSADGRWTFPNTPLTDKEGRPLTYTVVQTGLENTVWMNDSIAEITPKNQDGTIGETNIHVVNSYVIPQVPLTVTNEWIDGPEIDSSEVVTYTLLRTVTINGLKTTEEVLVDIVPNNDGSYDFGRQPTTDAAGNPYEYTVRQSFNDPETGRSYTTSVTSITPAMDPSDLNIEIVNRYHQPVSETTATTSSSNQPVARTGEKMTAPYIAAGSFLMAAALFILGKLRRKEENEEI